MFMSTSYRYFRASNVPAKIPQNCISKTAIVSLTKRGTHMFDEMSQRDLYSLNHQLESYVRQGKFHSVWSLFVHMLRACPCVDAYTFTPVLRACSTLPGVEGGRQVHGLMIKTGTESGTVSKTALMDVYSKYGYLGDCVKVFEEMEYKDVVTWNALLSSFLSQGKAKKALGVLEAMRKEGVEHSEFTYCSVLKACTSLKAFRQGKQVHGLVVVMGRDLVVLGTALIDFYSDMGCISEAMKVFSSLNGREDAIMRNCMLGGCVKNRKYEEAFSIMSMMRPNVIALTTLLAACSEISDLWSGKQIHAVAIRFGFISDTQLCNALLDMYAKCGKMLHARLLFDRICRKDVVSWTSMINAYGVQGEGHEAFALFKKMGEEGDEVSPNSVTYLAVLSACGHSGMVEEGRKCFNSLRNNYGLGPSLEHYACFMDGLGRAGRIEDMWCLYDDMVKDGIKPTSAIWATLLNACNLSQDVKRGEFAAKHLLESESNKPADYILLSNFYAATERWDIVDSLRTIMRERWLNKEVGSSWVTVAGCYEDAANL